MREVLNEFQIELAAASGLVFSERGEHDLKSRPREMDVLFAMEA
jgi:hypothetical protein